MGFFDWLKQTAGNALNTVRDWGKKAGDFISGPVKDFVQKIPGVKDLIDKAAPITSLIGKGLSRGVDELGYAIGTNGKPAENISLGDIGNAAGAAASFL